MKGVKHKWLGVQTTLVCVHIPKDIVSKLDESAGKLQKNRSELIRLIVESFVVRRDCAVSALRAHERKKHFLLTSVPLSNKLSE